MKISFIGTGSGKTSLTRYHSSLLFSFNDYNLLVDAGDGISRALLKANVNYNSINGILFSHLHPDHFSGLGALIVQMKMYNRTNPLEIFFYENHLDIVKEYLLACNLVPEKMDFEIMYRPFRDNQEFFVNNELKILPRENSHLSELKHYKQHTNRSFYSASFLFFFRNKNLMYTADIGSKDDLELFKEFDVDILICEVTHIPPSELLEKLNIIKPEQVYLTHITEETLPDLIKFLNTHPEKPGNMQIAEERQVITF